MQTCVNPLLSLTSYSFSPKTKSQPKHNFSLDSLQVFKSSQFCDFSLGFPLPIPEMEKELIYVFIFQLFCGFLRGYKTF